MATKTFFSSLGNVAEIAVGVSLIVRGYSRFRANGSNLPLGRTADSARAEQPMFVKDSSGKIWPNPTRGNIIEKSVFRPIRNIDERVSYILKFIKEGSKSPMVREATLKVLSKKCGSQWCIPEKNYLGEISALFWAIKDPNSPFAMRYVRDHIDIDQFTSADKSLQLHGGDCFPAATLLLTRYKGLVPIKDVQLGDEIWGHNDWTKVINKWDKGVLPTWGVQLSNGKGGRLTSQHKLWIMQPVLHRIDLVQAHLGMEVAWPDTIPLSVAEGLPEWWKALHRHGRGTSKVLRIEGLSFDNSKVPCFDIATEDHFVYLPQSDWTVSNCDDSTILLASMLGAAARGIGYPVKLRIIQDIYNDTWSHIFLLCGIPPQRPTRWVPLDTTVKGSTPGWQVDGAELSARTGRPAGYVTRVKDYDV